MTARYQDPDLPTNHEVTITFESTEVAYDTRALEADLQLVDPSIRLVQGKGMDVPVFSIADMDLAVQAKALETLQRKYRLMDQEDGMIRCTDGQQTFLLDPIADTRALRAQGALTTLETSVLAGKVVSSQTPPTLPYVMSETTLDPTVRQAHEKRIEAMQRKRERDGVLDKQVPKTEDLYTIYENGSLEKDARSASFNKRLQEYEMEPITDPATIDRLWEIHSAEGNAQFLPGRDPAAKAREQALDQLRSEGKITAEQRRILSDRGYMGSGVLITVAGGYLIYRNRQWILKQIKASK